jgi:NADPH-dependent glutamate synthase beta subunit-like oxidoreductase/NAD-dependent dihydropyrimidine dehydrogenase PreA subunit
VETKRFLIVGGSISGIQKAIELAEQGNQVYLLESRPDLKSERIMADNSSNGDNPFLSPEIEKVKGNPNIHILTNVDIERIEQNRGGFKLKVTKRPLRIIPEKCNDCKECVKVCPMSMSDDYNQDLNLRTAVDYFSTHCYHIIKERPICEQTCPVNLDIRGYIGLIADGKPEESLDLIREKLPFPLTIGRICPHPCEEACNRGIVDKPLCIRDLKRFVSDYELKLLSRPKPKEKASSDHKDDRVAIVGGGPAGLTCAHDLALKGYSVTIFESLPIAGGMLAVGIPDYRLPRNILETEINLVKELGMEIKASTCIGKDMKLTDLFNQGFKAIFIAVGAHNNQQMKIPGEDLPGVVPGVFFLRDLNLGREVKVGEKVGVIGGGNVAMDAARSSLRLGAKEVSILYRRSREEMPASDEEIEAALHEGIKIEYLVAPSEVVAEGGKTVGLKCVRMQLGEPDKSGRRRPVPIPGSEFTIPLDTIMPAIGQASDLSFIDEESGITLTRWGTIVVDPDTLAASRKGVFAGGDCVTGPYIAIAAIAAGKKAALSIERFLKEISEK